MSLYDYRRAIELYRADVPFYSLVMAAMLQADTDNADTLRRAFPGVHDELEARYHAPGGCLEGEAARDEASS